MCLDGPLYARTVQLLKIDEPLELTGQPGQRDGERWWTLGLPRLKVIETQGTRYFSDTVHMHNRSS